MFDSLDLNEITAGIKAEIKKTVSDIVFDLWFTNINVLKMTDMVIFISVPAEVQQLTIESRYLDLVKGAVKASYGLNVEVVIYHTQGGKITRERIEADERKLILPLPFDDPFYTVNLFGEPDLNGGAGLAGEQAESGIAPADGDDNMEVDEGGKVNVFGTGLSLARQKYTFDNFVVGGSNIFTYTACTVVAQYPATKYNPLFIHGQSGLGKTHLLYAILNETSRRYRNAKVVYVRGEDFTNQLIDSISSRNIKISSSFREKYRTCDMLLVDDIQFIAGKDSTQEEFFNTFNALFEDGKQIVMTSDRPPRDIKTLENRLTSRFESGLITDIQPPDLDLRTAILKRKAEDLNIKISNEVLMFLAENITLNIRQMEGAIKKLNAYSYLNNSGITLQLAKSSIADIISGVEPTNITADKVINIVSQLYNVSADEIRGRKRTKEITFARHICIYIIRKITDLSLPSIGKIFDRDHTTILSAIDTIEDGIKSDAALRARIDEIIKTVKV